MRKSFMFMFLGTWLIYLAFLPPGIYSLDGNSMLSVAHSLATHHDFDNSYQPEMQVRIAVPFSPEAGKRRRFSFADGSQTSTGWKVAGCGDVGWSLCGVENKEPPVTAKGCGGSH